MQLSQSPTYPLFEVSAGIFAEWELSNSSEGSKDSHWHLHVLNQYRAWCWQKKDKEAKVLRWAILFSRYRVFVLLDDNSLCGWVQVTASHVNILNASVVDTWNDGDDKFGMCILPQFKYRRDIYCRIKSSRRTNPSGNMCATQFSPVSTHTYQC